MQLTPKQRELVRAILGDAPSVFAYGATGGGKTYAAMLGFLIFALAHPGRYGLVSKTTQQARDTLIGTLEQICELLEMPMEVKGKLVYIGECQFRIMDGANVAAVPRIRGFNWNGAFVDEVYDIDEEVFSQIDKRVRAIPNAKLVMTGNPGLNNHWFVRAYVQRADKIGMEIFHFLQGDNPTLSDEQKQRRETYAYGGFYKRDVLGEYAPLVGLCFPYWYGPAKGPDTFEHYALSCDPADSGTSYALLLGLCEGTWWAIDEWRWDALMRNEQLTHDEQVSRIAHMVGDRQLSYIITDEANQSFALHLARRFHPTPVYNSNKRIEVVEGIQITGERLRSGGIMISDSVPELVLEIGSYGWDEKAAERGEDKPMKIRDHAMDCLRYFAIMPVKFGEMKVSIQ